MILVLLVSCVQWSWSPAISSWQPLAKLVQVSGGRHSSTNGMKVFAQQLMSGFTNRLYMFVLWSDDKHLSSLSKLTLIEIKRKPPVCLFVFKCAAVYLDRVTLEGRGTRPRNSNTLSASAVKPNVAVSYSEIVCSCNKVLHH